MAAQKKLEKGSAWEKYDLDGDGVVTDEELDMERRMIELEDLKSDMENEDKKQDAQRNMAWFALSGMLLYPFAVVIAVWFGLSKLQVFLVIWLLCILYQLLLSLPHSMVKKPLLQRKMTPYRSRKQGKVIWLKIIKHLRC